MLLGLRMARPVRNLILDLFITRERSEFKHPDRGVLVWGPVMKQGILIGFFFSVGGDFNCW